MSTYKRWGGRGEKLAVEPDSWKVSLSLSAEKGWFMAKARYCEKVHTETATLLTLTLHYFILLPANFDL